jgi:NADH-quinone oxidoreductase subunit J
MMTATVSPTGTDLVFSAFAVAALASAALVVSSRQLVHAALWLVVTLGAVAGFYLVMGAEFVAWMQVLIYVGAVVVLVVFALMLTRAPIGRSDDLTSGNRWVALVVAGSVAIALTVMLIDGFRHAFVPVPGHGATTTSAIGAALFRYWVLPFEALSVLLLAALVGAIVVSRGSDEER